MISAETHTLKEILSQPEAWKSTLNTIHSSADLLRNLLRDGQYDQALFTGCGSTYYLALAAAALLQETAGVSARGLPASEIWLNAGAAYPTSSRTLLVAISRSGETTETLRACEAFQKRCQGDLLTLSCYPERQLAVMGNHNLLFPDAREESVAQTRAFSSLYLATTALAALWSGKDDLLEELNRLPGACKRLLDAASGQVTALGRDLVLERFYFLGSGTRYGLACELSLKMKEMSLSHSEPFHFMEFRHGPQSMANAHTLMIGLVSQNNARQERKVLEEMNAKGAVILDIGEESGGISLSSGLCEAAANVLYLPLGQLLAFERSISKGLNPDRPHNLEAVVKLS